MFNNMFRIQESATSENSTINDELLKIRTRRLKWIAQDAREVMQYFNKDSDALKKAFDSLLKILEDGIHGVENTPVSQNQLYASTQAISRWRHAALSFIGQEELIRELINNTSDLGDKRAVELILEDIKACYQSSLEPTWVEKELAQLEDQFEKCLDQLSKEMTRINKKKETIINTAIGPSCFISYAWGIPLHEKWVHELAKRLKRVGVTVYLDIWHNRFGSIPEFIEKVNSVNYVIVIGTPKLREKSLSNEPYIIKSELQQINFNILRTKPEKIVKILLDGDNQNSFPNDLVALACNDTIFTKPKNYFSNFFNLLEKLFESHGNLQLIKKYKTNFKGINEKLVKKDQEFKEYSESLKSYYKKYNTIKRLFYEMPLPLEGNYIHLTIVNEIEQRSKEELLKTSIYNSVSDIQFNMLSEESTLKEAPQIFEEMYKPQQPILLANIINKKSDATSRVLITGLAGIGKSTLSQYLSYIWASQESDKDSQFEHWRTQFSFVFRIPLRELMSNKYKDQQNLKSIDLLMDYLLMVNEKKKPLTEVSEEEKANLRQQLELEERAGRVLLILDGYDEIARQLPSSIKALLKELLLANHIILTSRPYYLDDLPKEYNFVAQIQYRVTGFTDDNIRNYIANFFERFKLPKFDANKSLQEYLEKHASLWGPCHIPINLELICSTWEQHPFNENAMTMTELYNKVIASLCRRYLEKQSRDVSLVGEEDAFELCEQEIAFLEYWAFNSIVRQKLVGTIKDSLNYIKATYYSELNSQDWIVKKAEFIQRLLEAGFLKAVREGKYEADKEYYFPHRTFQEYFAARYLVRCMKGKHSLAVSQLNEKEPAAYIQSYRYDISLEVMWWFVAGLLYMEKQHNMSLNYLENFFSNLFAEPRDILGNYQAQIALRCWDEAYADSVLLKNVKDLKKFCSLAYNYS